MAELVLHGRPVETVFDLLGRDENDMTYALGWGLTHNAAALAAFVERSAPGTALGEPVVVDLQQHDREDGGYTDIEVISPEFHVIVEAKRGWGPPSAGQLRRYEARFARADRPVQRVVVLTQNGAESLVRHQLGPWEPPAPIKAAVVSWSDLVLLLREAGRRGPLAERRLVRELASYLGGLADMRNTESNQVYVVSLSSDPLGGWPASITAIQVVTDFGRYFFPAAAAGWPKVPPNYVAFRYWGTLQSIHHVDDYTIIDNPSEHFPGAPTRSDPLFLLTLGPAIKPDHEVRTGNTIRRAARAWIDLDLLLTSKTISAASELSKARRA
ncbi:MAG: hypothetical protein H0U52_08410 [Chloroflexi bacterium]|nr:hypothetical protein [Chloroflexota bacterium]